MELRSWSISGLIKLSAQAQDEFGGLISDTRTAAENTIADLERQLAAGGQAGSQTQRE